MASAGISNDCFFGLKKYVVYYSKKWNVEWCQNILKLIGDKTYDIHLECIDSYSPQEFQNKPYLQGVPVVVDNLPPIGNDYAYFSGPQAYHVIEKFLQENENPTIEYGSYCKHHLTSVEDENFSDPFTTEPTNVCRARFYNTFDPKTMKSFVPTAFYKNQKIESKHAQEYTKLSDMCATVPHLHSSFYSGDVQNQYMNEDQIKNWVKISNQPNFQAIYSQQGLHFNPNSVPHPSQSSFSHAQKHYL